MGVITRNDDGTYSVVIYNRKTMLMPKLSFSALDHLQEQVDRRRAFLYIRPMGFPQPSRGSDLEYVAARITKFLTAAQENIVWQAWVNFEPLHTPQGNILRKYIDEGVRLEARMRTVEVGNLIMAINGIYLLPG